MPIELLSFGIPVVMVAGNTYALPSRVCRVQASAAITMSVDGTTFTALTGADTTGVETSAAFIKAASAATVVCKSL